jgi:hypothetical protein
VALIGRATQPSFPFTHITYPCSGPYIKPRSRHISRDNRELRYITLIFGSCIQGRLHNSAETVLLSRDNRELRYVTLIFGSCIQGRLHNSAETVLLSRDNTELRYVTLIFGSCIQSRALMQKGLGRVCESTQPMPRHPSRTRKREHTASCN